MPLRNFFGQKNEAQDNGFNQDYYGNNEQEKANDDYGYGAEAEPETRQEAPRMAAKRPAEAPKICSMRLMRPTSYNDGSAIAEALIEGNAVILNVEQTDPEEKAKLIYFLGGVTYAIRGETRQVAADTYMLTPQNMTVRDDGADAPAEEERPAAANPGGYGYQGYGSNYRG